jgi:nucleoid DNA-binding protein
LEEKIITYINHLISQHDHVVIPGFGGFVSRYKPAETHPVNHQFTPPSKALAFNIKLTQNDGLLIHFMARKESIETGAATNQIKHFADGLNRKLNQNEVIVLRGIGKIFKDIEQNIQFVQDNTINHLPSSFGLPGVQADPVIRKKLVDTAPAMAVVKPEPVQPVRKRRKRKSLAVAASFIVLLGLSGLLLFYSGWKEKTNQFFGWNLDTLNHQMDTEPLKKPVEGILSDILPDTDDNIIEETIDKEEYTVVDDEKPKQPDDIIETEEEKVVPYPVEVNHEIPKGYFVIVGSFSKKKFAGQLYKDLKKEAYDAFIFPASNKGFMRVGVYLQVNTLREANQQLKEIRRDFQPDAWLVENK